MRDARRDIDEIVRGVRERADKLQQATTGDTGEMRSNARAALDAIASRVAGSDDRSVEPAAVSAPGPGGIPSVGDRVMAGPFGVEGIVQSVHDRDAEVDVRGKRIRVRLDELRVLAGAPAPSRATVRVNVDLQPRPGALGDLNVIGCTTDEALARAEKFLDDALVSEQRTIRVIHGHGTGQLRRAIGEFLARHPLVASHSHPPPEQGGAGVTVVELKE
jgi:DNA mismatch repair protein MutS2